MWTTSLITAAASEPLDLTEVASHLRLSADERTAQETLLQTLLASSRDHCERFTGRALISRELELWLSHWWEEGIFRDGRLRLPWPVVSLIESVKYLDSDGTLQTFSASTGWDAELPEGDHAPRAEVFLRHGQCYPSARRQPASIKIQYTTGYGDTPDDVPGQIKHGLLIWIAEAYARREEATSGTIISTNPIAAERCWADFKRSAA